MFVVHLASAIDAALLEPRKERVAGIVAAPLANIGLALAARFLWVLPCDVPSGAMIPTVQPGDHVLVWRASGAPSRGDVILLHYPLHPSTRMVRRVIAVGGDEVHIVGNTISVNGAAIPHRESGQPGHLDYVEDESRWVNLAALRADEQIGGLHYFVDENLGQHADWPGPTFTKPRDAAAADWDAGKYVVPPGKVFVLGDNRDHSNDSRYWGSVPVADVIGKVETIWWSSGGPEGIRWSRLGAAIH